MNCDSTILLTGVTGVFGKRLAYRLAALGHRVICLIRAGDEMEARDRFSAIFHELHSLLPNFDESLATRFRPIPGDVRQRNLGMPSSAVEEFTNSRIRSIWHLAALLDLTETKSCDVYDTNFVGTLNVLEFAKQQGIKEMHYFSTFGASGLVRKGIIREIPGIKPTSFRNTYERTKWEAERQIWQAQIRGEILASIYRPSIAVGDSLLGRYEQFNVFNHVFDVISRVRTRLCEKNGLDPQTATLKYGVRVLGDRNATLNIVPIDFVIDTVMKIYSVPGSLGRVYHIVNPDPPSLGLTEKIFKQNVFWEDIRWELFDPVDGFQNSYEKFIAKQVAFLTPYLLGEAAYDYSNVQTILALYGGIPTLKNEVFLDTIMRRGKLHGWQETKVHPETMLRASNTQTSGSGFVWHEGESSTADFSSDHSEKGASSTSHSYSAIERLIGGGYSFLERMRGCVKRPRNTKKSIGHDIVLVVCGMGVSRRNEGELRCYRHRESLASEVFTRMNQVLGFDLRAFSRHEVLGHPCYADIGDHCCWAVADDLVHLMQLFRDLQQAGINDFVRHIQILPHSGGNYVAGWLAGVLSFQDMILAVQQCGSLMARDEDRIFREEIKQWVFNEERSFNPAEHKALLQACTEFNAAPDLQQDLLTAKLHGKLELVFSLDAQVLRRLLAEVNEQGIGVDLAIVMSPNTAVFGGDEVQMARFRALFAGKRKIELRRLPLEVKGTPHCKRLRLAGEHAAELLRVWDRQGRLREPAIPFPNHRGEWVRTKGDFIETIAGIADKCCFYDRMIECVLEGGGRHFLFAQSGLASTAGSLFDGVIRNIANAKGIGPIKVYPPAVHSKDLHPICEILSKPPQRRTINVEQQSLEETIRWYENSLLDGVGCDKQKGWQ